MKRLLAVSLLLALVAGPVLAEPSFVSVSATSTAASTTLHKNVKTVTLYNAGSKTVFFRLFTDADVARPAEITHSALPSGASLTYTLGENDSEAYVGTTKAKNYASLSTICGGSDTTTVYVYFK